MRGRRECAPCLERSRARSSGAVEQWSSGALPRRSALQRLEPAPEVLPEWSALQRKHRSALHGVVHVERSASGALGALSRFFVR